MMCSGNRDHNRWNGVTFDGYEAGQRLVEAILARIAQWPDFDVVFNDKVRLRLEKKCLCYSGDVRQAEHDLEEVRRRQENAVGYLDLIHYHLGALQKICQFFSTGDEYSVAG